MNKITHILALCTILVILYQTTSAAPLADRKASPLDQLKRHKRHNKRVMTVAFNDEDETDAERIDEIEAAVTKLSRSRRSAAFFLQATLHYCSQVPRMCASVRTSSSDGANVEVRFSDR